MPSTRIRVNSRPYANNFARPNERIIEYASPNGGGLISLRESDGDGHLIVELYRHDPTVDVRVSVPEGS